MNELRKKYARLDKDSKKLLQIRAFEHGNFNY